MSGRRLAARARAPLANLYELYPEARTANPRELGLRFVPLEEIRGTAVAGAAQRGGDFLPLKPFRGDNWRGRWARIKAANERLQSLPPVDLVKYDGAFWVMDGHNRVAAALYAGGVGLDAVVTELIPLGASSSERPASFAPLMGESAAFRAAVQGRRPAFGVELAGQPTPDEREADERPATATEDRPTPQPGERGGESERGNAGPGSASLDRPGASA